MPDATHVIEPDHVVLSRSAPVLIVDDNANTREALEAVLSVKGFSAVAAADGREALDYLRGGGTASLIILDLCMPGMDGYAFRAAQMADPLLARIPVVIFTATADSVNDPAPLLRKGADPDLLLALIGTVRPTPTSLSH
jgi:CheY-like chemotaxis protein